VRKFPAEHGRQVALTTPDIGVSRVKKLSLGGLVIQAFKKLVGEEKR